MKRINHHPTEHPKSVASQTGTDREVAEELLYRIALAEAATDWSPKFSRAIRRIVRELGATRRRKTPIRPSAVFMEGMNNELS